VILLDLVTTKCSHQKLKPTEVPQESPATAAALPGSMDQGAQVILYADDRMKNLNSMY